MAELNITEIVSKISLEVNNKLEDFIVKAVNEYTGDQSITVNAKMIYEAVQKQIPMRPDYEGDGYADGHMVYDTFICPSCGTHYEVDYDDYMYCPKCGQRLDLTEVDTDDT